MHSLGNSFVRRRSRPSGGLCPSSRRSPWARHAPPLARHAHLRWHRHAIATWHRTICALHIDMVLIEPSAPDRNVAAAWMQHFLRPDDKPLSLLDHSINGFAGGCGAGAVLGALAQPVRWQLKRIGYPVQPAGALWFMLMRWCAAIGGASAVGITMLQRLRARNDAFNPALTGGVLGACWQVCPRVLPASRNTQARLLVDTRAHKVGTAAALASLMCTASWWLVGANAPTKSGSEGAAGRAGASDELRDPWEGHS
jgi:hypothetical protein